MMDENFKSIQQKLDETFKIYIGAKDIFLYTQYFHNPKTQEEKDLVTKSSCAKDLQHIMHFMFRSLIVETSKLINHSRHDHYSIFSLINSVQSTIDFDGRKFSPEQLKILKEYKKEIAHIKLQILEVRNKIYAHTDPLNFDASKIDLDFKNIENVLNIVEEILRMFYSNFFDNDIITRSPTFDRERFSLLKKLAEGEKIFQQRIIDKWTNWANTTSSGSQSKKQI